MLKRKEKAKVLKLPKGFEPEFGVVDSISSKGFHKLFYREWKHPDLGERGNRKTPVMCLHGLTRNSRDFDNLASHLCTGRRVICPDTVGRGHSDWLRSNNDYNLPQYNLDVAVVAAQAGVANYDIVGTSLGGLMGIVLASMDRSPIRRLVINDIGPEIPMPALKRLGRYVGENPLFETIEEVDAYVREKYEPFGPMSDDEWREIAEYSSYKNTDGYRMAYDPTIAENYKKYWLLTYFNIWEYWEKIECPVLILRGTESDFLTENLRDRMLESLPHAELIEFEGAGHTPTLRSLEQINPIREWLDK